MKNIILREVKNIILREGRFTRGEIEKNIGKLETRENSNFFFGWRGVLVGVAGCGGLD